MEVFVGLTILPMGFKGAVDVAQAVLRELVFGICRIDPATELRKDKPIPSGDEISILCLDGFDFMRVISRSLRKFYDMTPSVQHASFTDIIRPRTVCIVQAAVR